MCGAYFMIARFCVIVDSKMAECEDEDPLDKWCKENKIHESTRAALKQAEIEFEDLIDIEESDINELNDGKGLPIGPKRRLISRINDLKKAQCGIGAGMLYQFKKAHR